MIQPPSKVDMVFFARVIFSIALIQIFSIAEVHSQKKCGTTEYMKMLKDTNLVLETETQFEAWINERLVKAKPGNQAGRRETHAYEVNIVVHVIHNGEPVGVGSNISDEQIWSQIEVLNLDFQRLNADASLTPSEFQSVAGGMNIEFKLADVDPAGSPTNGINRVLSTRPGWTVTQHGELKSLSYWPSENYINIWVSNLTDEFYGFTQFPISTLPGLENSSRNRLTDGIIISYRVFGSSDYGDFDLDEPYDKGRAATHEMGHFFGLRHLWGDVGDCEGSDYVQDTPPQSAMTIGCPEHPLKECPSFNPVNKMFHNYMDFTDDACMNLFTLGQVSRMKVVLENSPRRASLLLPLPAREEALPFPKIFSPNNDGVNDFWMWPNPLKYRGCKLIIYNRFGKLVYEKESYDNTWDGRTTNGKILEEEAYYYVIKCDGEPDLTGGVRIVR